MEETQAGAKAHSVTKPRRYGLFLGAVVMQIATSVGRRVAVGVLALGRRHGRCDKPRRAPRWLELHTATTGHAAGHDILVQSALCLHRGPLTRCGRA